jgi:hypothetical protein
VLAKLAAIDYIKCVDVSTVGVMDSGNVASMRESVLASEAQSELPLQRAPRATRMPSTSPSTASDGNSGAALLRFKTAVKRMFYIAQMRTKVYHHMRLIDC